MNKALSKKAFKPVQNKHKAVDFKRHVPRDWLRQFIALCKPIKEINTAHLNEHIGTNSTYRSKDELVNALQYHYVILSGKLNETYPELNLSDDQKSLVISKLMEEIDACTPGFHGRVNSVLESYFLPKTIPELFHNIRTEIIERTATTSDSNGEVHNNNRYFIVAENIGYGVNAKLDNDPYRGIESDEQIETNIRKAFAEEFQPFSTLRGIREIIISRFELYNGRNEKGYNLQTFGPGLEYLKILFNEENANYGYLVQNDDGLVIDINWDLILHKLWKILIQGNYFNFKTWDDASRFIPGVKTFVKKLFLKHRPPHKQATTLVEQSFLAPAALDKQACKTLCCLFSSEIESFAYLTCNPNLPIETRLNIFIASLEHFSQKDALDINKFWDFAVENPDLTEACCGHLAQAHAGHLFIAMEAMQQDGLHQAFLNKNNLRPIKRMLLQLNYAEPDVLNKILHLSAYTYHSNKFNDCFSVALTNFPYDINQQLLHVLKKLPHHQMTSIVRHPLMALASLKPKQITSDYLELLTTFDQQSLFETLLSSSFLSLVVKNPAFEQANLDKILGLMEKLSDRRVEQLLARIHGICGDHTDHAVCVALQKSPVFFIPLIEWMQKRPTLRQAVDLEPWNHSILNYVAKHQPRLFPKTHHMILGMDAKIQTHLLRNLKALQPNSLPRLLLELNQKVLELQANPERKKAFEAATELQTTLNQALINFYDKKLSAADLNKISSQAIPKAHKELGAYWESGVLLANLALVLLSIPTLGVPLLINYYNTGYKQFFFFQNPIVDTLDSLSTLKFDETEPSQDSRISFAV